jgi:nucleotide-binding universal stress UspA family protein
LSERESDTSARSDEARTPGILVALDLSPGSRAAATLATELAAALGTRIEALFVEDRELLELAGHPLAWQVDAFGTVTRGVERVQVERSLRAQASRARRMMARVTAPRGVAWSLRVVRGSVVEEIRTASRRGVVVSLGRTGWSRGARGALGRTARRLLSEEAVRVLVPGRRSVRTGPVIAVYAPAMGDGDEVLATAKRLAAATGAPLRVELLAQSEAEAEALRERAEASLARAGTEVRLEPLVVEESGRLARALADLGPCGLLVLPAGILGAGADRARLVSELDCPVLLIR